MQSNDVVDFTNSFSTSSEGVDISIDTSVINVDDMLPIAGDIGQSNRASLIGEQQSDESLNDAFKLAGKNKSTYIIKDD
jgi:hypothetical protein